MSEGETASGFGAQPALSFEVSTLTSARHVGLPLRETIESLTEFAQATLADGSEESKLATPAFIPAVFKPGKGREKGRTEENIEACTAIVLDYDEKQHVPIDKALTEWGSLGFELAAYTTNSHRDPGPKTKGADCFRIVIPLASPIPVAHMRHLRERWLLPYAQAHAALPDPACSDPGRIYFLHVARTDFDQQPRFVHVPGPRLDASMLWGLPGVGEPPGPTFRLPARPEGPPLLGGLFKDIGKASPPVERLDAIEAKCNFMRAANENAETIPEPAWRSWLSVLLRCKDGEQLAHEIGFRHPGYKEYETTDKMERLKEEIGGKPHTCETIRQHGMCAGCPLGKPVGTITSPAQLGRPESDTSTPEEVKEYAEDLVAAAEVRLAAARAHEMATKGELAAMKADKRLGMSSEPKELAKRIAETSLRAKQAVLDAKAAEKALTKAKREALSAEMGADSKVLDSLERDERTGIPKNNLTNASRVFLDPKYKDRIWRDEMRGADMIDERRVSDDDMIAFRVDVGRRYQLHLSPSDTDCAFQHEAAANGINELVDYLNKQVWDGVPRLGRPFALKLGVSPEDPLLDMYAMYLTKWPVAAVSRAMQDKEQVDIVLALQGARGGEHKTSVFRKLAGPFFGEAPIMLDGHQGDLTEVLWDAWIHELAESLLQSKRGQARVKAFLTYLTDQGRGAFKRKSTKRWRRFLFCMSINDRVFLDGDDGGELRRYLVIPVGKIDLDWVEKSRDQLWAEAMYQRKHEYKHWFSYEEVAEVQKANQRFVAGHPWEDEVEKFLGTRNDVVINDILIGGLRLSGRDLNKSAQAQVGVILRRLGWRPKGPGGTVLNGRKANWWIREKPLSPEEVAAFAKASDLLAQRQQALQGNQPPVPDALFRGIERH
jgi:hypothetical protein